MLQIAICDDETAQCSLLESYVREWERLRRQEADIALVGNGEQLLFHWEERRRDILLLDIDMPGVDGLSLARRLRGRGEDVQIVFVTGLAEYALEGYKVNAFDYLIKPVSYEKLTKVLAKILKMIDRKNTRFLTVRNHDIWYRVALGDIVFVETLNRHCVIHTVCGFYVSTKKMRDLEKELPEDNFFRCNSGYIVNFDHIEKVVRSDIYLRNNEIITVSRSRKKQFIDRLAEYWGEEM